MVTVTVLVVQMATSTFSARYMRLWYRDRMLKVLLALLVGTLAYSFTLLRRIEASFVPDLAVSVAGFLVVADLLLFVVFLDRFLHRLRPVAVAAFVADYVRRDFERHAAALAAPGVFTGVPEPAGQQPELVIVDEPTAGLDPEERVRFRNVLSEIGFGKLVILSTHIVSDVESVATEIAVMKDGALLTMETPEALLRTAEGSVWQSVVSSEEFDKLRTTLKISGAVRKPDGVHVRFVGPAPAIGATAAEPELEDAFLYLINFGQGGAQSLV